MTLLSEASFLVTPNGYKEDKLYAAIPTNGNGDMTVTRATTATRVNKAGLIELVPYNLLSRSEEFDNTSWIKNYGGTGSAPIVTANQGISPDGNMTAERVQFALNEGTGSTNFSIIQKSVTVASAATTAKSIYLKSFDNNNYDMVIYETSDASGTNVKKITVTGEWQRFNVFGAVPSTSSGLTFGLRNIVVTGLSDSADILVWGAQLVKGSSALTYQKTVDRLDIPRIDYTGGGCPSILLEPQRTNLVLRSQEFDNASFIKGLSSVTPNTTTAPDGTLTAYTWTGNGASGSHYLAQTVSATSGVAYTQSVFAKKGTNDFIQILGTAVIYDANSWANFDLENGVVGSSGASATATITDFGNGWYRCTMTATATATASGAGFTLRLITSAASVRGETNSLATNVHLWGAQVEEGAYPTSYIPTVASTVTRNADVINRDDIYTNNLITAAGGTWFIELNNNIPYTRDNFSYGIFLNTLNNSNGNGFNITNGIAGYRLIINKVLNGIYFVSYITLTDVVKIAIKWNGSRADIFVNGVKVITATPFTSTNMEFLSGNGSDVPKYIKSQLLFPTPLTDSECQALTTL